jgi:Flp pilus assembly protein TadD
MLTCIVFRSPEEGDLAKARGNAFVKEANWPFAIREYTDAVKRNPENPVYYSNRAMVYMKVRRRFYNMLLSIFIFQQQTIFSYIFSKN